MSEQENKELIKKGYAAFTAGDVETVMSLFDDDVEWVQPGESAVSGTYHGKAEVMEYMSRLAEKSRDGEAQSDLSPRAIRSSRSPR